MSTSVKWVVVGVVADPAERCSHNLRAQYTIILSSIIADISMGVDADCKSSHNEGLKESTPSVEAAISVCRGGSVLRPVASSRRDPWF